MAKKEPRLEIGGSLKVRIGFAVQEKSYLIPLSFPLTCSSFILFGQAATA